MTEATTNPAASWHRGDWMQTYMGLQFYPMDPRPEDIDPIDIGHALGLLCRYNGHVDRFYSVAEHCVLMSQAVPPEFALEALLHDATEAYVGDMIRPLKVSMPAYREAEDRVMVAIAQRFNLPLSVVQNSEGPDELVYVMPPAVKDADNRILLTERATLMRRMQSRLKWSVDSLEPLQVFVEGWDPEIAALRYLERLDELQGVA